MADPWTPKRANDTQQDVNYVPNEIDNTMKGGSAHPGSAVGYGNSFPGSGAYGSGVWGGGPGFVGTRHVPDEDEK